jgi:KaiC protein
MRRAMSLSPAKRRSASKAACGPAPGLPSSCFIACAPAPRRPVTLAQGPKPRAAAQASDGMSGQGENPCPVEINAQVTFSVPRRSGSSAGLFRRLKMISVQIHSSLNAAQPLSGPLPLAETGPGSPMHDTTELLPRAHNDIVGLDAVFEGGWARNRLHLLEASPGTGKTTIALQFLIAGARNGERPEWMSTSPRPSRAAARRPLIEIFELVPPEVRSSSMITVDWCRAK